MSNDQEKSWYIHARRNATLFHLSFLMPGLYGRGWAPVVDFWLNDTIVAGYPNKGGFIYLNEKEVTGEKYVTIQQSVEQNPNFIADFRRRTNEIFGALFFACNKIEEENLPLLSITELADLYREYMDAVLISPLITVQVYGIEALVDPNYKLIKALEESLKKLSRESDFDKAKETLLTNDGETVAFSERKDFYRVCVALTKNPEAKDLIDTHIKKYHWVNMEYRGTAWSREKWEALFNDAINDKTKPPAAQLAELMSTFDKSQQEKQNLIKELNLTPDVVHIIDCLGEFLAQRDWTKGYFARSLPSLHKLMTEIAARMGLTFEQVLTMSYLEIFDYFKTGAVISQEVLQQRQVEGYAFVVSAGELKVFNGQSGIEEVLKKEQIENPTKEVEAATTIKGLVASLGKVQGIVHVIDSAAKIPEFKDGEVLVTYMTTIEFTPLFRKAVAVVTDEGGMSCHAAIVSREFKLPCIVGTKIATRALKDGDMVEVDATKGIVTVIK